MPRRAEGRQVDARAARGRARFTIVRIRSAYLEDGFTHLFVVPADGGTRASGLTTGKWSVGAGELRGGASIDWTPDSKSVVFDGNRSPDADMQYETSQIYVADVATGAIRELVNEGRRVGQAGRLARWPHGRVHRLRADGTLAHRRAIMYVIPITGGASDMRKISGDFDRDPINMRWAPDGTGSYFDADDQRRAQRAVRVDRGRRQAGHDRAADALVRFGVEGSASPPASPPISITRRTSSKFSVKQPGQVDEADRRQRRRAAGHPAREDRGDHLHVDGQHEGHGLDREAAVVRRLEEVLR